MCQFFITKVRKNHTSCMSFLREILSKITVFIQIEDNSDHIKKSFCMGVLICIIYLFKLRIIFFYFQKLSLHHLFLFCLFERGTSRIFFISLNLLSHIFQTVIYFWTYSWLVGNDQIINLFLCFDILFASEHHVNLRLDIRDWRNPNTLLNEFINILGNIWIFTEFKKFPLKYYVL